MLLRYYLPAVLFLIVFSSAAAQGIYYTPAENYGGKQALKDLIKSEMVYPILSRQSKEEGTVLIQFTVSSDGTTRDIQFVESAGANLDAEARRLFDHLLWIPARSKGFEVDSKSEVEITFHLKRYLKNVKQRGYDQLSFLHTPVDKGFAIYEAKKLDTLPRPIYGEDDIKFDDFIVRNMKYPDDAKKRDISGTVAMFFVVEPSGNITNLKVEKSVGAGCTEEAQRLIKLLKWFPGIKDGLAVRTAIKLNITFNLNDSDNMKYVPANNNNQI